MAKKRNGQGNGKNYIQEFDDTDLLLFIPKAMDAIKSHGQGADPLLLTFNAMDAIESHGQGNGKSFTQAFDADEPLLFTPKAMDALDKSIALLTQDAKDFRAGKPDYYRYLCNVCTDTILRQIDSLKHVGLYSRTLQPKKADDRYAAAFKEYLERIYATASDLHGLLWELYCFNADSKRSRAPLELDVLVSQVLFSLQCTVVQLAKTADYFSFAYQISKDAFPALTGASMRAVIACGTGAIVCIGNGPRLARAWIYRLQEYIFCTNVAFLNLYRKACIDCQLTILD